MMFSAVYLPLCSELPAMVYARLTLGGGRARAIVRRNPDFDLAMRYLEGKWTDPAQLMFVALLV